MRTLLTLTLVALALPAAAAAGGYATAGLGPPPAGTGPGDVWRAEITIKAHGIAPAEGLTPTLTIRGPETRTFRAEPTGEPGVYVAEVVFPTAGTYRYEVLDGYAGQVHTFAPIRIDTLPVAGGSGFPAWAIAPIVVGGAVAAALLLRRHAPRPATALR